MHPVRQKQFTVLKIEEQALIDSMDPIGFVGSCFAQNIGCKLSELGYPSFQSPFGVVFNPVSITDILKSLKAESEPWESFNGEYFSFRHHHKLRNQNLETLKGQVVKMKEKFYKNLQSARHLFISLGSAWCYKHISKDIIVANCHRIPQAQFKKILLTEEEVFRALEEMVNELVSINKDISIYFTISPVKHLKDGILENVQSKARLVSALQTFLSQNKQLHYFPSLEIVQEELRDYRYYADDLAHPSKWTIGYIFSRWVETYFTSQNQNQLSELIAKKKAEQHRPSAL